MRDAFSLLRSNRRARLFFAVVAQSSLGSGAAFVGLLLIALDRFRSPWAISLVLLADFVPAMALGPVLGAVADRWSRRWCMVAADLVRVAAFVGVALVDSFPATVAFAVLAGVGTALFKPAALAGLPGLFPADKRPAATALYGAVTDMGYTAGPALAAIVLLVGDAESLMWANAATFALSAAVLARLPLDDAAPSATGVPRSLLRDTRQGMRAAATLPVARVVIAGSAGAMLLGGLFNVAEPIFATVDLHSGGSGYAILVASFGLGFVLGSLQGAAGGEESVLKRRYLDGLVLMAVGLVASGLVPSIWPAIGTFALAGFGNGLLLVHERLLIQVTVPVALHGRVFAMSDSVVSWAFAFAFLSASPLVSGLGARTLILATGLVGLAAAIAAALSLRTRWAISSLREADPGASPGATRASEGSPSELLSDGVDSLGELHAR